ncbi:hypothetical protein F9U64_10870 [Gracilibacillus oryzae]|uniref:Permease n=1 Tax=Gracilibacillus oryzae TaxID=1672701 RepID=A0A7C8GT64_9BACI|nr:hypothetical protein [Gracilibacillus oryzae]KAB8135765.1 hypothetical protein F9U64_10870 [Gracilibacillus oryzae]
MNKQIKRYWILMVPYCVTFVILLFYIPNNHTDHFPLFVLIPFWSILHSWNFLAEKLSNKEELKS